MTSYRTGATRPIRFGYVSDAGPAKADRGEITLARRGRARGA